MSQARTPAQVPDASVDAVLGLWSVRAVEGEGRCQIALSNFRDGHLYGVTVERCSVSALAGATGWRPVAGGFELVGVAGGRTLRFTMTGVDAFRSSDGTLIGGRAAMR